MTRNESCRTLLMSGCKIKDTAMSYIGLGISENTALVKFSLSENEQITKDGLTYLVKGIIDADDSNLIDIDLSKCNLSSSSI